MVGVKLASRPHLSLIPEHVKNYVLWKSHSRARRCTHSKRDHDEEKHLAERITASIVREAITARPRQRNLGGCSDVAVMDYFCGG
jgi:hypothetical protein